LGSRYSSADDDVEYIRDPRDLLQLAVHFDAVATVPANTVDTGYRSGNTELWAVPGDGTEIFVVTNGRAERWPAAEPPVCS
jgi:hypothetical protein